MRATKLFFTISLFFTFLLISYQDSANQPENTTSGRRAILSVASGNFQTANAGVELLINQNKQFQIFTEILMV